MTLECKQCHKTGVELVLADFMDNLPFSFICPSCGTILAKIEWSNDLVNWKDRQFIECVPVNPLVDTTHENY